METIADIERHPMPGTNSLQDTLPELDLLVSDYKAILSYKRQDLIKFSAQIRIAPEELVDYVNRGILQHMTEIDRVSEATGLKIISRCEREAQRYPLMTTREPLSRLLLQQKWYTLYFITEEYPFTRSASGDSMAPAAIPEQLSGLLSPGKALVDYKNYRIFLKSLAPCCTHHT